jgi:hypothetical protein
MSTMQAAVAVDHHTPLALHTLNIPEPGAGQVLVRVIASAVNPLDTKIHAGKGGHARQPLPAVLGMDLAGVVVANCAVLHGPVGANSFAKDFQMTEMYRMYRPFANKFAPTEGFRASQIAWCRTVL